MESIFTLSLVQNALELGLIYALTALALFISFRILNIADLSTHGLLYARVCGLRSGNACGSPDAWVVCGDGGGRLLRICDVLFADKA